MIKKNSLFLVYYSSNIINTAEFWKKLGVQIVQQEKDKVVVKVDSVEIHYVLDSSEPFNEYKFATQKINRGLGSLLYFEAEDIETLYKISSPKTPILKNHWQGQEFLFKDPDGYCFVAYKLLN